MHHLLLLIFTMSACVASAMHIEKRANTLICNTPASCKSYYNTGSAQCDNGYKRTNLEVPGFPLGSTCSKACDDSEIKQCGAQECTDYKKHCDIYPAASSCAQAIDWCRTPIKTTKDYCVQLRMSRPVKYDDAAGTCAADPDATKDGHSLQFIVSTLTQDANLYLSCAVVTTAGAQSVIAEIKKTTSNCVSENPLTLPKLPLTLPKLPLTLPKLPLTLPELPFDLPKLPLILPELPLTLPGISTNTDSYKIEWRCTDTRDKFDKLTQVFKDACAVAAHPGDAATTFEAYTG